MEYYFGRNSFGRSSWDEAYDNLLPPVVPDGNYTVLVRDTVVLKTKNGNGHYLLVKYLVANGPHKGVVLSEMFQFDNPNETTVAFAAKNLRSLCMAVGMPLLKSCENEHENLQDKYLVVTTRQKIRSNDGQTESKVERYAPFKQ